MNTKKENDKFRQDFWLGGATMTIEPIHWMSFGTAEKKQDTESSGLPFSGILKDAVQNLEQVQKAADEDSYKLATGNADLNDLSQMMINSSKQTAALQLTVQLTTRVVNAYKEILQMQV